MPELIMSDHDAIVTLVSEVKQTRTDIADLKIDIKEIKDNVSNRVADLEQDKLDKQEALQTKKENDSLHAKFEQDIDNLKNWRWYVLGITTGFLFLIELYFRLRK